MRYSVDSEVFTRFPGFRRVVLVAQQVDNSRVSEELEAKLRACEEAARQNLNDEFKSLPQLQAWAQAFSAMGLNPNKFPPSVTNLLKRVRGGKDLPYINTLVAIFNCVSLSHMLPCGGDDLGVVKGDLRLGIASGKESYVPLGQPDAVETPPVGEVIYYDTGDLDVFCRAWCWKNGNRSKLEAHTRSAAINVDVMHPVSLEQGLAAAQELADMVRRFTGAEVTMHQLGPDTPSFDF